MQKKENETDVFYKNALYDFLLNPLLSGQPTDFNLDKYIAVFSLFMRYSNNAYKYNLPYLAYQHKKFQAFLNSASKKYELLHGIMEATKGSHRIQQFIQEKPQEDVKIHLNDFLASNLSGIITFHETFSFSGAQRNLKNDVVTVLYNDHVRSCKVNTKLNSTNSIIYEPIVSMIERALGLHDNDNLEV